MDENSIISALAAFAGGAALMAFVKPDSMPELFIRCIVTAVMGIIFAPIITERLPFFQLENPHHVSAVAFIIGFLGWTLLGTTANFLRKQQNKDIFQVVQSVKKARKKINE